MTQAQSKTTPFDEQASLSYGSTDPMGYVARGRREGYLRCLADQAPKLEASLKALEAAAPALAYYSNLNHMREEDMDEDGYCIPLRLVEAAIAKAREATNA